MGLDRAGRWYRAGSARRCSRILALFNFWCSRPKSCTVAACTVAGVLFFPVKERQLRSHPPGTGVAYF